MNIDIPFSALLLVISAPVAALITFAISRFIRSKRIKSINRKMAILGGWYEGYNRLGRLVSASAFLSSLRAYVKTAQVQIKNKRMNHLTPEGLDLFVRLREYDRPLIVEILAPYVQYDEPKPDRSESMERDLHEQTCPGNNFCKTCGYCKGCDLCICR